jgi:hypothetical protein
MSAGAGYSHNVDAGLYRGGSGSCSRITRLQFRFELSFTTNGNFIDVLLGVKNINTKSHCGQHRGEKVTRFLNVKFREVTKFKTF